MVGYAGGLVDRYFNGLLGSACAHVRCFCVDVGNLKLVGTSDFAVVVHQRSDVAQHSKPIRHLLSHIALAVLAIRPWL